MLDEGGSSFEEEIWQELLESGEPYIIKEIFKYTNKLLNTNDDIFSAHYTPNIIECILKS